MGRNESINQDLEYLRNNVEQLNQKWKIEDPPVKSQMPLVGGLVTLLKRCIRKSIYWLIRPYWEQQISFNATVTAAISDIYRIQSTLVQGEDSLQALVQEDPLLREPGPRIIQLVSSLNFGDAVGNEVIAFKRTLQENGYATEIYTNNIHSKIPAGTARFYRDMPPLKADDLVIYHFASECAISKDIKNFPCKVVLRYHNVTPPEFFHGFDANAEKATANGLRQVKEIMPYIDYCLPVSEFNMNDLKKMGYTCPMEVLPILIRFEDYEQEPDAEVVEKYSDGITNILFVGRMAPNKKVEDVISSFAYYKEHYDATARLFLVGSYQETDKYYQFLQRHIEKLGVQDVIFPGHISFKAILAYYKIADVFLCMSEHEGFCVPLVEAMYFSVPIVAYDSSAIASTLNGCGILLDEKDNERVAASILDAKKNKVRIISEEHERLHSFEPKKIAGEVVAYLKAI